MFSIVIETWLLANQSLHFQNVILKWVVLCYVVLVLVCVLLRLAQCCDLHVLCCVMLDCVRVNCFCTTMWFVIFLRETLKIDVIQIRSGGWREKCFSILYITWRIDMGCSRMLEHAKPDLIQQPDHGCCNIAVQSCYFIVPWQHVLSYLNVAVDLSWWFQQRCSCRSVRL